jgi:hypothetical protein
MGLVKYMNQYRRGWCEITVWHKLKKMYSAALEKVSFKNFTRNGFSSVKGCRFLNQGIRGWTGCG